MKKLGVVASFIVMLVATTITGPKPAIAQENDVPDLIFVCVDDSSLTSACVEILAFGYTLDGNTTTHLKKDGSIGLASRGGGINNVTITKFFETEFSPWLIMSAIRGQAWQQVSIEVVPPGCNPTDGCFFFQVVMTNVFVQSCNTSVTNVFGDATNEDNLDFVVESCTFVADNADVLFP